MQMLMMTEETFKHYTRHAFYNGALFGVLLTAAVAMVAYYA